MTRRLLPLLALSVGLAYVGLAAPATPALKPPAKPADPATATPAAPAAPSRPIPFHGKVLAIDAAAHTLTLNGTGKGRVFAVTDKTTFIGKDGAPSTLAAVPVGEEVRGSALKAGTAWQAHKVIIGAKDAAATVKQRAAAAAPGTPVPAVPAAPMGKP